MSPIATTESPSKLSDLPDHESQTSDVEGKTELHEDALAVPEGKIRIVVVIELDSIHYASHKVKLHTFLFKLT